MDVNDGKLAIYSLFLYIEGSIIKCLKLYLNKISFCYHIVYTKEFDMIKHNWVKKASMMYI